MSPSPKSPVRILPLNGGLQYLSDKPETAEKVSNVPHNGLGGTGRL
jgi:hypothetical protein